MKIIRLIFKKPILTILCFLILAFSIISISNLIYTKIEKVKYPPPGKFVIVNGNKMHVYSEGKSDNIIVLLSGLGTTSPVLDFKPLIKALKNDFTVVVLDYFGYGWSDVIKKKRSVKNIVDETRQALLMAGFKPPYILMPHSISGLYSLYYANNYPSEIKAVVGNDISIAEIYLNPNYKTKFTVWFYIARITGFLRVASKCFPSIIGHPIFNSNEYSIKDLNIIRLMTCWNLFNQTVSNEYSVLKENALKVKNLKFPNNIPVLMLVSQEVNKTIANKYLLKKSWFELHRDLIENNIKHRSVLLPGYHYLHWNCSKLMTKEIKDFLKY